MPRLNNFGAPLVAALAALALAVVTASACVEELAEARESEAGTVSEPVCFEELTWPPSNTAQTKSYHYDAAGRLAWVDLDFEGDGGIDERTTYEYDAAGRLVRELSDGGQAPPDGEPDVVRTLFYACEEEPP